MSEKQKPRTIQENGYLPHGPHFVTSEDGTPAQIIDAKQDPHDARVVNLSIINQDGVLDQTTMPTRDYKDLMRSKP